MTQINRIYGNSGLNMVRPDQRPSGPGALSAGAKPQDQVEISEAAERLSSLQQPGIRMDKVEKARLAIAQGNYETADKFEVVVDRILREVNTELDR
jgi:anti-sigma28 factor (negative regulator of flagellin synthesis)